jgi:CPA2 family monovalent cation:H+ antiporter-2
VVLLLFMLGLEYTGDEVAASLRASLPAGLADLVLNFPPGFLAGLLLGWDPLEALLLGGVTYISSSSIVAKVLDDLDRLGNRETPAILGVLVLEDMAMAPYLPLVAVLVAGGSLLAGALSVAAAVAAVAGALVVALRHGRAVSRGLHHPSDEVVLLTIFGLLLVVGGIAESLQLSAGVVAFLVGLMISGAVAERARQLLAPLRDLFAALFFVLFGLQIDVGAVPQVIGVAAALWLITAATKMATGWIAARGSAAVPGRLRAGTVLVARGEFSIVIAGLAVAAGRESQLAPLAATYVLLTALSGPLLTRYADRLAPLIVRRKP